MPTLFWDASALGKNYVEEEGTETVQAFFKHRPRPQMLTTPWGYTETYSILRRHFNRGTFTQASFAKAIFALRSDVVGSPSFEMLPVDETTIFSSVSHTVV